MITVILIVAALVVLAGVVYLVMASGAKGKRHGKASEPVVRDQESNNPRGDVRSGTGPN